MRGRYSGGFAAMLPERLSRLIDRTYAAAEGSEPWSAPLGEIRRLLRGRMTSLLEYRTDAPGVVREAVGLDPAYRASYDRYYWSCNIYLRHAGGLLRPGVVAPHEAYCTDRDILRSEYYQDFQRRLGLFRVVAGAMTSRAGVLLLTVSRGPHDRGFSAEDLAIVRLLLPHVQRAIRIQERLPASVPGAAPPLPLGPAQPFSPASARAAGLAAAAGSTRPGVTFTAAESAVAARLIAGQSIAEICAALRIRESTVRTHLQHLFQKTQTRRQAELVAWLLRG